MIKIILFIFITYMFVGCTTTKPSITEYKIIVDVPKQEVTSSTCKDKSMNISQAFSSASLMSLTMDYVKEPNKVYSYAEARWQESPNRNITGRIFQQVRNSDLFKNVSISKSRSRSDLVLEIVIEDFLQYYTKDLSSSYVKAVISFSIIDLKTSKVISSKTFSSKLNTNTLDASGGVGALSDALSDILNQNTQWLVGVCK